MYENQGEVRPLLLPSADAHVVCSNLRRPFKFFFFFFYFLFSRSFRNLPTNLTLASSGLYSLNLTIFGSRLYKMQAFKNRILAYALPVYVGILPICLAAANYVAINGCPNILVHCKFDSQQF